MQHLGFWWISLNQPKTIKERGLMRLKRRKRDERNEITHADGVFKDIWFTCDIIGPTIWFCKIFFFPGMFLYALWEGNQKSGGCFYILKSMQIKKRYTFLTWGHLFAFPRDIDYYYCPRFVVIHVKKEISQCF